MIPTPYDDAHGNRAPRSSEIDALRGLAIALVVGGHVVFGAMEAGAIPVDHPLARAYEWALPFRVASMVLVAGLFVQSAVARTSPWRYLTARGLLFGWLYLVWFVVQTAAEAATNPWRNHPMTSWIEVVDVWNPPAQLYFLPTLWVCTALVVLARSVPVLARRPWIVVLAAAALSIALWGWGPGVVGVKFLALVVFLAIGCAVGVRRFSVFLGLPSSVWVGLAGIATIVYCALDPLALAGPNEYSSFSLVERLTNLAASCIGVVMMCGAAVLIARTRILLGVTARLGVHSSSIYVAHIVVAAGARIVLDQVGTPPLVAIACAWALGVVVPLALAEHAPRFRVTWLFAPPVAFERCLLSRAAPGHKRPGSPNDAGSSSPALHEASTRLRKQPTNPALAAD